MPNDTEKNREIDSNLIRRLAGLLDETGLTEIEYGEEDWRVRVAKKPPSAPITVQSPASSYFQTPPPHMSERHEEADPIANHPGVVVSPMVGVVYTSEEPNSTPFVKVGDRVKEGDNLLLIEAMKVYNQIKAPRTGKIIRILVSNGMPVEFGEPLLIIE